MLFFNCKKIKTLENEVHQIKKDIDDIKARLNAAPVKKSSGLTPIKVAFVAGHNRLAQGATVKIQGQDVTEWEWAQAIFKTLPIANMKELAAESGVDLSIKLYLRPEVKSSYSTECRYIADQMQRDAIDLALEEHFNGGNGRGTEVLTHDMHRLHRDLESEIAYDIAATISQYCGTKLRRDRGVLWKVDGNAFKMLDLNYKNGVPYYVLEPEFNLQTQFFENSAKYTTALSLLIVNAAIRIAKNK